MTRTLQGSLYVGGQISQKVTLTIGGPIAAPSLVSCVMITRGGLSPDNTPSNAFGVRPMPIASWSLSSMVPQLNCSSM